MRCVAALLVKDEADRFFEECLKSLTPRCDTLLVLDDGSTDRSREMARDYGCQVRERTGPTMWGHESSAREELWAWGSEVAGEGWMLIADADQELIAPLPLWEGMLSSWEVTAWGIPLYDVWDSPTMHRTDGYWQGFHVSRPWLFKPSACLRPEWSGRGLHVGHAPGNFPYTLGTAPEGVWWKHYGWMRKADRDAKLERYLAHKDQLLPGELAHLLTVSDDADAGTNP